MGGKKISILIKNEINNHQIYVPVFYLIEIDILVAFWGQKWWKKKRLLCCLSIHRACMQMHGVG